MNQLPPRHPIVRALKKSKIVSKELRREFSKFLADFDDWEAQALYLLEDKGELIEKIIEDLYDVPQKHQLDWVKPTKVQSFEEDPDLLIPPPPKPGDPGYGAYEVPQFSFKDWKQEHGFLKNAYSQCLQETCTRVDLAFKAFFRRVKKGQKPDYLYTRATCHPQEKINS